jgi:hypothetical protein
MRPVLAPADTERTVRRLGEQLDERRPIDRPRDRAADVHVVEGRNGEVHRQRPEDADLRLEDPTLQVRVVAVSGDLLELRGGEAKVHFRPIDTLRDLRLIQAERELDPIRVGSSELVGRRIP